MNTSSWVAGVFGSALLLIGAQAQAATLLMSDSTTYTTSVTVTEGSGAWGYNGVNVFIGQFSFASVLEAHDIDRLELVLRHGNVNDQTRTVGNGNTQRENWSVLSGSTTANTFLAGPLAGEITSIVLSGVQLQAAFEQALENKFLTFLFKENSNVQNGTFALTSAQFSVFGTAKPVEVTPVDLLAPSPVPLPAAGLLLLGGLSGFGLLSLRRRRAPAD